MRKLTMAQAINEAQLQLLEDDPRTIIIGCGVGDPKNVFGTTTGLREKFPDRIFDSPISENGVTGICIGAAVAGLRPIHVHQRMDFMLYAMDQIVNNAAKWHSMFGGKAGTCPIVIRCVIGRGWGQGNQHSQDLVPLLAKVPGLIICVPSNAYDAKGLLIAAHRNPNPVIFVEHRWLHDTVSKVPLEMYEVSLDPGSIKTITADIKIHMASGYDILEYRKAHEFLSKVGITCHLMDRHTTINNRPYPPSTHGLSKDFYLNFKDIIRLATPNCIPEADDYYDSLFPYDQPNKDFRGPF